MAATNFLSLVDGRPTVLPLSEMVPSSEALTVLNLVVQSGIGGHKLVWLPSLDLADATDTNTAATGGIIGMTLNAASVGGNVDILISGRIIEPTWNFSFGRIYLGNNGGITQIVPTSCVLICLGYAFSSTEVFFRQQQTFLLE